MVKNAALLARFEREWKRKNKVNFAKNLKIADALYKHGKSLGVFPRKNPLGDLEGVMNLAKALQRV